MIHKAQCAVLYADTQLTNFPPPWTIQLASRHRTNLLLLLQRCLEQQDFKTTALLTSVLLAAQVSG